MESQLSPELFEACIGLGVALLVVLLLVFAAAVSRSEVTRVEGDDVP